MFLKLARTCFQSAAKSRFLPFEEAREFARTLGFTSRREWVQWAKSPARPRNIPANPYYAYQVPGRTFTLPDFLGYSSRAASRKNRAIADSPEAAEKLAHCRHISAN